MKQSIIASLICVFLTIFFAPRMANAATSTAIYLDAMASITVPDTIPPDVPFDVTVEGELVGFPPFSVFSYAFFRDATWTYSAAHLAIVSSGILIEQSGFEFGNAFTKTFSQTLPAGNYSYTFIFGQRSFGHGWYDVGVDIEFTVGAPKVVVDLDVKPQSCPNPLSGPGPGILPAAILGSADLDVSAIDPTTVLLAGVPPLRNSLEDVAAPVADGLPVCACTGDGPDGYVDLTLKFDRQQVFAALGPVSDGDTVVLSVSGALADETLIEGQDCVVVRDGG